MSLSLPSCSVCIIYFNRVGEGGGGGGGGEGLWGIALGISKVNIIL